MDFHTAPYQTLARNDRNWHILHLSDGRLQLDFGPFAIAFHREAFQLLHGLCEAALKGPTMSGCIAHAGVERSAWFEAQRGTVALAFDGAVLRFLPHELVAFTALCREAGGKLGVTPCRPASDSTLN
jgi:hypothetical protein